MFGENKQENMWSWNSILIDLIRIARLDAKRTVLSYGRFLLKNAIKAMLGLSVAIIGLMFLLIGIAKLLNAFINFGDWPGYVIIGFILLLIVTAAYQTFRI
jgi:hypothetical protein